MTKNDIYTYLAKSRKYVWEYICRILRIWRKCFSIILKSVFSEIRVMTWFQVSSFPPKKQASNWYTRYFSQSEPCFLAGDYLNSCPDSDLRNKLTLVLVLGKIMIFFRWWENPIQWMAQTHPEIPLPKHCMTDFFLGLLDMSILPLTQL